VDLCKVDLNSHGLFHLQPLLSHAQFLPLKVCFGLMGLSQSLLSWQAVSSSQYDGVAGLVEHFIRLVLCPIAPIYATGVCHGMSQSLLLLRVWFMECRPSHLNTLPS